MSIVINDNPQIPHYPIQPTFKKSTHQMKIVVVGDGGCGKTCLLVSYTQQKFPEVYVPTVFENYVANVLTPNNKLIELALWDTAGQEEYDRLRPLSYPDVDVLLICFSLDNVISLQNVRDTWFPEVNHFCPGVPILLVGTKLDLGSNFDADLPIQVATEINAIGYIQCSAKSMFNVANVFNFAINNYHAKFEQEEKAKKRLSFRGHSKQASAGSLGSKRSKGHLKNSSMGSSILYDTPLTEEERNPYTGSLSYDHDDLGFTRRGKKKGIRCTIL